MHIVGGVQMPFVLASGAKSAKLQHTLEAGHLRSPLAQPWITHVLGGNSVTQYVAYKPSQSADVVHAVPSPVDAGTSEPFEVSEVPASATSWQLSPARPRA
jgi:hypothetical protein